jgi:GNAT superfamily N-acetyltransferase
MDDKDLLAAYDAQLRGIAHGNRPDLIVERDGPVTRVAGQFRGFVSGPRDLGVDGPELDALIARQRDYFAARGEPLEWKTRGHDLPADLPERLRAAGFVPEPTETVLIGVASEMAIPPALPPGLSLAEVRDEADLRDIGAMESAVWNEPWDRLADDLMSRIAAAPDEIAVYAVRDDATGQVVSAAWLVFMPGTDFAGLWGGSTLAQYRGRGIYRALIAVRAQRVAAWGARYLQVDASDDSSPILQRLGFRAITTTTPYVWSPPASE